MAPTAPFNLSKLAFYLLVPSFAATWRPCSELLESPSLAGQTLGASWSPLSLALRSKVTSPLPWPPPAGTMVLSLLAFSVHTMASLTTSWGAFLGISSSAFKGPFTISIFSDPSSLQLCLLASPLWETLTLRLWRGCCAIILTSRKKKLTEFSTTFCTPLPWEASFSKEPQGGQANILTSPFPSSRSTCLSLSARRVPLSTLCGALHPILEFCLDDWHSLQQFSIGRASLPLLPEWPREPPSHHLLSQPPRAAYPCHQPPASR